MANKYINKSINLTTTNLTTIYTVPDETVAIIKAIQGFNDTASAVNVMGASARTALTLVESDKDVL